METPYTEPLRTRKHFAILDGLRGVAAFSVVVFHFMEWKYTDYTKNFIGHGFLAVDFFFCLSGFVVAYAYDQRIVNMGKADFFISRFIRLHPLVVFGSVLGLLEFLFDPFAMHANDYGAGRIMLIFLLSIFLIPFPVMEDRFFNLFGLNPPAWSLFWEYIANIAYAMVLYKIGKRYLVWLLVPAAALICYTSYRSGNLVGGWSGGTFWDGGVRVFYSFLAGMFIYRSNWIIKNRIGFAGMSFLLLLAFVLPVLRWNWLAEALVILIYFPLLISLGAGSALSDGLKKVCTFSGNISYPLYMTHYAGISIFGNFFTAYNPSGITLVLIVMAGSLFLLVFAWLVMVLFDMPLRKYLTGKRKNKQ